MGYQVDDVKKMILDAKNMEPDTIIIKRFGEGVSIKGRGDEDLCIGGMIGLLASMSDEGFRDFVLAWMRYLKEHRLDMIAERALFTPRMVGEDMCQELTEKTKRIHDLEVTIESLQAALKAKEV